MEEKTNEELFCCFLVVFLRMVQEIDELSSVPRPIQHMRNEIETTLRICLILGSAYKIVVNCPKQSSQSGGFGNLFIREGVSYNLRSFFAIQQQFFCRHRVTLPPFVEASLLFRGSNGALQGAQDWKQLMPDAPPLVGHDQRDESRPASGCGPFLNFPLRQLLQFHLKHRTLLDHTNHA